MAHLNESGLQAHSVGDLYPWTIVGTQTSTGKTAWFAWNTIDDTRLPVRAAYKDAELDVARYELAIGRGQKAAEDIAAAETARKLGEDIAESLKGLGQDRSRAAEKTARHIVHGLNATSETFRLHADKTLIELPHLHNLVARATYHFMNSRPNGQRLVRSALAFRNVEVAADLRLSQVENFLAFLAQ